MNDRYTTKDIKAAFKSFCMVTGLRHATSYTDIGAYSINKGYGGYQVVQLLDNGAQATPFGMRRHSAKEMAQMLQFAADVHRTTNQEQ